MSCMRCDKCSEIVDTDFDTESLYITGWDCLCESCRERTTARMPHDWVPTAAQQTIMDSAENEEYEE